MKRIKESWADLDIKTKVAYSTAVIAFLLGWVLTIAAFFVVPIGIISDSVLWVLGQSLVYTASVFGVGMYVTGSVRNMKREIGRFMQEEDTKFREPQEEEEIIEEEVE